MIVQIFHNMWRISWFPEFICEKIYNKKSSAAAEQGRFSIFFRNSCSPGQVFAITGIM
jgi:hypothetical protein